jgi:hypothetical protein
MVAFQDSSTAEAQSELASVSAIAVPNFLAEAATETAQAATSLPPTPRENRIEPAAVAPIASFLRSQADTARHRTQPAPIAIREVWAERDFNTLLLASRAVSDDHDADSQSAAPRAARAQRPLTHATAVDDVFSDLGRSALRRQRMKAPI